MAGHTTAVDTSRPARRGFVVFVVAVLLLAACADDSDSTDVAEPLAPGVFAPTA